MSRVEAEAKPVVEALMTASPTVLDPIAIDRLATWCTLKLMTAEWLQKHPMFTAAERTAVMTSRTPPETLQLWCYHMAQSGWSAAYRATSHFISQRPPSVIGPNKYNIKLHAFGVGRALFLGFYSADPLYFVTGDFPIGGFRVFPANEASVEWPRDPVARPMDVAAMSNSLTARFKGLQGDVLPVAERPGRRYL